MKAGYTHISVVLDRSSSMVTIKKEAETGINSFIADQKALDGDVTFTLAEFDRVKQAEAGAIQ